MLDRVASLSLRLLSGTIRILPLRCFSFTAAVLFYLVRPFLGRDLRRLRANVQRVYGLPAGSHFAKMFEHQVLRHTLRCGLETLRMMQDRRAAMVQGFEELRSHISAVDSQGKGFILVTAHLGSWELCAAYGRDASTQPLHVLAKPPKNLALRRFLEEARRRMRVQVLWTDRKTLLRDMLTALRRGEAVGFVMDQKPEGRNGPQVDFLGLPTEFVSGPAQMAIRTGCGIVSIFCVREGAFRYRLVSRALAPAGHALADEVAVTQMLAGELERVIRLYPEQWTWNYKRWRDQ